MNKFDKLLSYLPALDGDVIGTWVIDHENDGTPERPIQMPFVHYSEMVNSFIEDVYDFEANNKDFELTRYNEILDNYGLAWDSRFMSEADVSKLDAQCVMALIMGAVRAERFCDGALLEFFQDGSIKKWLERLKELG